MKKYTKALAGLGAGAALMTTGLVAGPVAADTVSAPEVSDSTAKAVRTVGGAAVSNGAVTVGDTVTITNTVTRKGIYLVYFVRDQHPQCLDPVPNSSEWTVSGKTYTNKDGANGFSQGEDWVRIDSAGWQATPLVWKQDYVVNCPVGPLNTGGLSWSVNLLASPSVKNDIGPTLQVKAAPVKEASSTSVSVAPAPKEGDPSTITATVTSGGSAVTAGTVEFFNNGTKIGSDSVSNGKASITWRPSAAGSYTLKAVYSGAGLVNGSEGIKTGTVTAADPAPEAGAPAITLDDVAKVGSKTTVRIESDAAAGSPVALTVDGASICNPTLGADGKASCEWTPTKSGPVVLKATVDGKSTEKTVNVAAVGNGGDPTDPGDGPGDGGAPNGSSGSLESILPADIS